MEYFGRRISLNNLKNFTLQRYNNGSVNNFYSVLYCRHCLFGGRFMKFLSNHFREEFLDILDEVRKQAECEYVQRYVDIPPIPYMRLHVLFLFLLDAGVPFEKIKNYLVPTILIQLALDCHDEVTLFPQETERGIRTRQLSVLAGDYYSSKYYFLLSKIEDIQIIRSLARSIGEINELKTILYSGTGWEAEKALQLRNQIDSALYVDFIPKFCKEPTSWLPLIQKLILVERLQYELNSYQLGQALTGFLQKLTETVSIEQAIMRVQAKIEGALIEIESYMSALRSPIVKEELHELIKECQRQIINRIRV